MPEQDRHIHARQIRLGPPTFCRGAAPQYLVLAGGEGNSMNSDLPEVGVSLHHNAYNCLTGIGCQQCFPVAAGQVLHPVAELPVLCHVLRAVQGAQHSRITVVVSRQSAAAIQQARRGCQQCTACTSAYPAMYTELHSMMMQVVRDAFPELQVDFVVQQMAGSWGDAVHCALQTLPESVKEIIILSGSLVLLTPSLLDGFVDRVAFDRKYRWSYVTHYSRDDAQPLVQGAEAAYLREKASVDGVLLLQEPPALGFPRHMM